MGKTVGKITVVEVAQCYGIQFELPEEVYPYLLNDGIFFYYNSKNVEKFCQKVVEF